MENATLPAGLQNLTVGYFFNQDMRNVMLPSGLLSLVVQNVGFSGCLNPNMQNLAMPRGLQSLSVAEYVSRPMENLTLPSGLQSLEYGHSSSSANHWAAQHFPCLG